MNVICEMSSEIISRVRVTSLIFSKSPKVRTNLLRLRLGASSCEGLSETLFTRCCCTRIIYKLMNIFGVKITAVSSSHAIKSRRSLSASLIQTRWCIPRALSANEYPVPKRTRHAVLITTHRINIPRLWRRSRNRRLPSRAVKTRLITAATLGSYIKPREKATCI